MFKSVQIIVRGVHNKGVARVVEKVVEKAGKAVEKAEKAVEKVLPSSEGFSGAHRHFDKMLYEMMPATFTEFKSYPFDDPKGSFSGAHRHLDHMLYDMMPATFSEFRSYPFPDAKQGEDRSIAEPRKEGEMEDTEGMIWKEFFSPFFSGRMMMPLKSMGTGMQIEEEGEFIKCKIDTSGFKAENVKITMIGNEVRVEAKEDFSEMKDGLSKSQTRDMFRCFTVPRGTSAADVTTALSPEGELTLSIKRTKPVQIPLGQGEEIKVNEIEGKPKEMPSTGQIGENQM